MYNEIVYISCVYITARNEYVSKRAREYALRISHVNRYGQWPRQWDIKGLPPKVQKYANTCVILSLARAESQIQEIMAREEETGDGISAARARLGSHDEIKQIYKDLESMIFLYIILNL